MATSPSGTAAASELKASYAAQVTADLDRNTEQQQRLGAEIASLQEQLGALQHDHTLLENMRRALQAPSSAPATPQGQAPSRQRTGAATKPSPTRTTGVARRPTKKTTAKPARGQAPTAAAQPTLVDLIRGYLARQSEPRSAADITDALTHDHPERSIKPKVIRTTIEVLVGRSLVRRHKHNRSVSYTAGNQDTGVHPTGS